MGKHIVLVNNTGSDIRMFESNLIAHVLTGAALDDSIDDLLAVEVIEVDGKPRGIVTFA